MEGEVAVITCEEAKEADYNLSPSRWIATSAPDDVGDVPKLIRTLRALSSTLSDVDDSVFSMLRRLESR